MCLVVVGGGSSSRFTLAYMCFTCVASGPSQLCIETSSCSHLHVTTLPFRYCKFVDLILSHLCMLAFRVCADFLRLLTY